MADHERHHRGDAVTDAIELSPRVRAKRRSLGLSIREAAAAAHVSAPTFPRVERGHVPERDTLLRLARWADVRIDPYLHDARPPHRGVDVHGPDASTLEAVELHLRADKNLSDEAAETLSDLVRVAYTALANQPPPASGKR